MKPTNYTKKEYNKLYNEILSGLVVVYENNLEKLDTKKMLQNPRPEIKQLAIDDLGKIFTEMIQYCIRKSHIENKYTQIYKDIVHELTLKSIPTFHLIWNV